MIVPGHEATPDLLIDVDPLSPRPDDLRAWIDHTIAREIPAHTRVQVVNSVETQTAVGWPVQVLHVVVLDREDRLAEVRLVAFYKLSAHAGMAMIRGTHADRWERHRAKLLEILLTGRPDYRGRHVVAAIDDLFH